MCYYTKSSDKRLDFRDADWVLESRYRIDVPVVRNDEMRLQSLAQVLAALSLAHAERGKESRLISVRKASAGKREMSHEWLENDFTD